MAVGRGGRSRADLDEGVSERYDRSRADIGRPRGAQSTAQEVVHPVGDCEGEGVV